MEAQEKSGLVIVWDLPQGNGIKAAKQPMNIASLASAM